MYSQQIVTLVLLVHFSVHQQCILCCNSVAKDNICRNLWQELVPVTSSKQVRVNFYYNNIESFEQITYYFCSTICLSECYPPPCTTAMSPCPLPCGMNSCPMSPASSYPSICPATLPAPAPLPAPPLAPPQCPAPCPTRCAPACNSLCCRSMVRQKSITGEAAKKSSTKEADDFDDEDDDAEDDEQDEDDDVEENDDSDIDETN